MSKFLDWFGRWEVTEHDKDLVLVCEMDEGGEHVKCVAEFLMVGRDDSDWDEENECLTDAGLAHVVHLARATAAVPYLLDLLDRFIERADSSDLTYVYDPLINEARQMVGGITGQVERVWDE